MKTFTFFDKTLLLYILGLTFLGCKTNKNETITTAKLKFAQKSVEVSTPKPVELDKSEILKSYEVLLSEINSKRKKYKTSYEKQDLIGKTAVLEDARKYLNEVIVSEVFPQWYGTEWNFYGTTRTPKKGKIACGYFVTNILTDVGFNIPRVKWAQSASEIFIKKLAFGKINRFSNKDISHIKSYLKKAGNGLYLVGLDNHVGFVTVKNNEFYFIHADYYEPEIGVISEKIDSHNPLKNSAYRVFGKLLSDEMMISWIYAEEIK